MQAMEKFKGCYECKYRDELPGSAHSKCTKQDPVRSETIRNKPVELEKYGVMMGWCDWPYNFDPVWVNSCGWYEDLEQ